MMPPRGYALHEIFIAPAQQAAALWRLLGGLALVALAYFALGQMYFQLVMQIAGPECTALWHELDAGSSPRAMLILLFSFGLLILGLVVALRILHSRSVLSLLGPLRLAWEDFRRVVLALAALVVLLLALPPWGLGEGIQQQMPLLRWLQLLPLGLLALLVQVSAEELLFRGYLQQQLAVRFRSPLVWMLLPSALFALGHYQPEEAGENAIYFALWAGAFGLLAADLTARAGSLGPAIALHFVNNAVAMLLISLQGELSGLALYLAPFAPDDDAMVQTWLPVDFALMLVFWLTARVAIRR